MTYKSSRLYGECMMIARRVFSSRKIPRKTEKESLESLFEDNSLCSLISCSDADYTGRSLCERSEFLSQDNSLCAITSCADISESDSEKVLKLQEPIRELLSRQSPLLNCIENWSRYYYKHSSKSCQEYYNENVCVTVDSAVELCGNSLNQNNADWESGRQKRITGSNCYDLFKYCNKPNPNWKKKLYFSYSDISFCLNNVGTFGLYHQKAAKHLYIDRIRKKGFDMIEAGLVVNPLVPFLGFSPDGIVLDGKGHPVGLIEIKCPPDGRIFSSQDLVKLLPFVEKDGTIRSNYKYYGQVQLGMFVLGLPYCDFLIYSSSEDDYLCTRIIFDAPFIQNMLRSLLVMYFEQMLPWLTNKFLNENS